MKIKEVMSKPAFTCRASDTLNTAAQLMWEHDCGAISVVNDGGKVVGMITDRDICMSAYTQGIPIHTIPVSNAMATRVFSCRANDPVDEAERLMRDKQIRRLPVVDGENRPIGFLSLGDIARYAASVRKKNGLDREVTQTLAGICEPRIQTSAAPRSQPQATRLPPAAI